jgi:hypothetical protein
MSGLANTAQSDLLKLLFQNTAWANVGNAGGLQPSGAAGSFYISLHTADPTNAGSQTSSEATYTNYARVAVARSSAGFTISGSSPTSVANAAVVSFPACGVTGNTVTYFAIGRDVSGVGEILVSGPLTSSLIINNGITPSFAIGALVATVD